MYLKHHGIKGQKWGVRRYQNPDGTLTAEGYKHYGYKQYRDYGDPHVVFVSGSSKTQFKDSGYYRKKLPRAVRKQLKSEMKAGSRIIVGDAPGVDRQTQDYLAKKKYDNVEVFGPGKNGVRYSANKNWKQTTVNVPGTKEMSSEWLAGKDFVMQSLATKGIAVVLDEGAKATRKNVDRLVDQYKSVYVYELNKRGRLFDRTISKDAFKDKRTQNQKKWESQIIEAERKNLSSKTGDLKIGYGPLVRQMKKSGMSIREIAQTLQVQDSNVEYILYG